MSSNRGSAPIPDPYKLRYPMYRQDWLECWRRWRRGEFLYEVETGDTPPDETTGRIANPDSRSRSCVQVARPLGISHVFRRGRSRAVRVPRRRCRGSRSNGTRAGPDDPDPEPSRATTAVAL